MSGSYTGQNRNTNVAAMLMYAVQKLNIPVIETVSLSLGILLWNATLSMDIFLQPPNIKSCLFQMTGTTPYNARFNYHVIEMDRFIEIRAIT